ncbi:MAG: hypothetical protein QXO16_04690 [Archaeoglobaceae archaeon]
MREKAIGSLIFVLSLLFIAVYGWLIFASAWSMLVLQLTVFVAVALLLCILAFIGYTLATTPSFEAEKSEEKKD